MWSQGSTKNLNITFFRCSKSFLCKAPASVFFIKGSLNRFWPREQFLEGQKAQEPECKSRKKCKECYLLWKITVRLTNGHRWNQSPHKALLIKTEGENIFETQKFSKKLPKVKKSAKLFEIHQPTKKSLISTLDEINSIGIDDKNHFARRVNTT